MNKKQKFMDKLSKAMDDHGYRPDPVFITKLGQLPEELFEKALDAVLKEKINKTGEELEKAMRPKKGSPDPKTLGFKPSGEQSGNDHTHTSACGQHHVFVEEGPHDNRKGPLVGSGRVVHMHGENKLYESKWHRGDKYDPEDGIRGAQVHLHDYIGRKPLSPKSATWKKLSRRQHQGVYEQDNHMHAARHEDRLHLVHVDKHPTQKDTYRMKHKDGDSGEKIHASKWSGPSGSDKEAGLNAATKHLYDYIGGKPEEKK